MGTLRGNVSASRRPGNGLTINVPLLSLRIGLQGRRGSPKLRSDFFLLSRHPEKSTPPRTAITDKTMPTIAPGESLLCEGPRLLEDAVSVSEVRLGLVAKVENEGVNVM